MNLLQNISHDDTAGILFFAESLVVLELVKIIVGNKFATKDFA
jgi:hypothetical protein